VEARKHTDALRAAALTELSAQARTAAESLLAGGKTHLIAVGALHLVGPQGLVEMLRARGYTVTEL
jgi:uncharacterized protein YbaP (TraB family)